MDDNFSIRDKLTSKFGIGVLEDKLVIYVVN